MPAGLHHDNTLTMADINGGNDPLLWMEAEVPDPPKSPPTHRKPLAYFDIETTGLDRNVHTVIEVAIIREDTGAWETKIKPTEWDLRNATPKALEVNGYTDEAWADAPTLSDVMPELAQQLHGVALVGHNAQDFDHPFLLRLMDRLGWASWLSPVYIDTMILARSILPLQKVNLDSVCEHLGIEKEGVHRAIGGARRVQQVMAKLKERMQ